MSRHPAGLRCLLALILALPPGSAAAHPAPTSQPVAELLKRTRDLARKTARLRGLRLRRRIETGVMSREQIVKRVEQRLDEEYSAEEIATEAAVLKQLGLLPEGLDYRKAVLGLLKEQVAGFYDPKTRRLSIADWIAMDLQEPALVHEMCHALQDQHFRLRRLTRPIKDNSDQQLARAALVEGDCTGVMLEHMLRPQGLDLGSMPDGVAEVARQSLAGQGSPALNKAPSFLRETLLFPYLHGLELIRRVRARHPWRTVNVMYRRPPASTEQVLHYAKYWGREKPVPVRFRALPCLTAYREVKRDVLGEFQLSLLLGLGVAPAVARRAAAGWGGDRLVAYRKDDALLLVHLSTWDSDEDALEYANALRYVLVARKLKRVDTADAPRHVWTYADPAKLRWSVQLVRRHVLTLAAVPTDLLPTLRKDVWRQFRVGGRRVKVEE